MAIETQIQWCDSTNNVQMGCEGCELVKHPDHKPSCYAKVMTDRYAGRKGWPSAFEKPALFLDRIPKMINWPDLTGTNRPAKPWLNGQPRVIFLNDMGDTFTKGLPENWFAEVLPQLAASPHLYLVLTKWPQRFAHFSAKYPLPENVCPGTSVTSEKTSFRVRALLEVQAEGFKWVSAEPLWSGLKYDAAFAGVDWVIFGGESGSVAKPCDIEWIRTGLTFCKDNQVPAFVKQLGARPMLNGERLSLKDGHGGDWEEWPEDLRIREFPRKAVTFDQR
jgi:protein gp37